MKLSIPRFISFLSLSIIGVALAGACSRHVVRKEIRDLTVDEWEKTKDALQKAYKDGVFDRYAQTHTMIFDNVHFNGFLFPWHRRFIRDFEYDIQKYYPDFALPYWDTTLDYRAPAQSRVLSPQYMGRNGRPEDSCVVDGVHANWIMNFPERHCLQRNYNAGNKIAPWYSEEFILSALYSANSMRAFQEIIETTVHLQVHIGIQGDMGDPWALNDFTFLLLHANIDRIWNIWQNMGHTMTIDGNTNIPGVNVTLDAILPNYNETSRSVMRLGEGDMCYTYQSPLNSPYTKDDCRTSRAVELNLASTLPEPLLTKWFPGLRPQPERNTDRGILMDSGEICPQYPGTIPVPNIKDIEKEAGLPPHVLPMQFWGEYFVNEINDSGYHPLF